MFYVPISASIPLVRCAHDCSEVVRAKIIVYVIRTLRIQAVFQSFQRQISYIMAIIMKIIYILIYLLLEESFIF